MLDYDALILDLENSIATLNEELEKAVTTNDKIYYRGKKDAYVIILNKIKNAKENA